MSKKDLGIVPAVFAQFQSGYYISGEKVGQAWNAGKPLMQKQQNPVPDKVHLKRKARHVASWWAFSVQSARHPPRPQTPDTSQRGAFYAASSATRVVASTLRRSMTW